MLRIYKDLGLPGSNPKKINVRRIHKNLGSILVT